MFTILGKGIFVRFMFFPPSISSFCLERFSFVEPHEAATLVTPTFSTLSSSPPRRQKEFRKIATSTRCTRVIALQATATPVIGAVGDLAGAVQAVAVKVPTFWPTCPEV